MLGSPTASLARSRVASSFVGRLLGFIGKRRAPICAAVALLCLLLICRRIWVAAFRRQPITLPAELELLRDRVPPTRDEMHTAVKQKLCSANPFLLAVGLDEQRSAAAALSRFDEAANRFVAAHPNAEGWATFDVAPQPLHCSGIWRYGGTSGVAVDDGGKWLCALSQLPERCVIYSLGSNNDFGFEEAMLRYTDCETHTFDCTSEPPAQPLSPRAHFHRVCIGADSKDGRFKSLATIMTELKHESVSLLKMDIEGFEHDVLRSFAEYRRANPSGPFLPMQMSVELHRYRNNVYQPQMSTAEVAQTFKWLAEAGYVPVSREDNVMTDECSEFTFLRLVC